MNVIGTGSVVLESKKKWFVFEHSQEYQELQILFMNDVHNADLDFMFNMISEHPYHIDSILQLNELCKYAKFISYIPYIRIFLYL